MMRRLPSGAGAEKDSMIVVSMMVVRLRPSYSMMSILFELVITRWPESGYQERLVVWRESV